MPAFRKVYGEWDPKFNRVKEVFEESFESGKELGAGVAVTIEGRPVIELWGGYADVKRLRAWERNTLVNVYSTTKGATAVCVHRLVDQGLLDLDEKVARYWPEFAQQGKEEITVRLLLCHRAGLPAVDKPLRPEAIFDWDIMTRALAEQAPYWSPGTRHGYHARTYGWLLGEIIRRVTGKTPGTYFREQVAGPLGLDFHIGLPESEHGRVAFIKMVPPPPPNANPNLTKIMLTQPESLTAKAFLNPPVHLMHNAANTPEWRRAELPASNGHATAPAIARLYGMLACGGVLDGTKIVSPESVERARTQHSRGPDEVLIRETRFGLGFMMPLPGAVMGPNDRAFGHPGLGGSLGFADPEARIGFGYVMNQSGSEILIDPRPAALIDALYACI